jgi:hypothetical protein
LDKSKGLGPQLFRTQGFLARSKKNPGKFNLNVVQLHVTKQLQPLTGPFHIVINKNTTGTFHDNINIENPSQSFAEKNFLASNSILKTRNTSKN